MLKKSVVIATPDRFQRNRLVELVNRLPEFKVIAMTSDLMNTYTIVEERSPKAVLIADVLARPPEFEVMRALFATLDIRWLVVTPPNRRQSNGAAPFSTHELGSDLFSISSEAPEGIFAQQLGALTRIARQRQPVAKAQDMSLKKSWNHLEGSPKQRPRPVRAMMSGVRGRTNAHVDRLILIGASTGGVDALLTVLSRFPEDCPPTLVVQHTGTGFGQSLAGLLDRQSLAQVSLLDGCVPLRQGQIVLGAGTQAHLVLKGGTVLHAEMRQDAPVEGHVPSVDVLFKSAVHLAPRVNAAILTGMGRDGASGMKALRDAGAYTIAQDEASCVVYGMPRAAVQDGAVCKVLPLDLIGDALLATQRADRAMGGGVRQ